MGDRELRSQLLRYFGTSSDFEQQRADLPDTYRAVVTGLLPAEFTLRVLNRCLRAEASPEAAPVANTIAALESCDESPQVDARALLTELREHEGLAVEAGRLAYELGRVGEALETFTAQRRETLAALERRGLGRAPMRPD